jgi:hypothetical protein
MEKRCRRDFLIDTGKAAIAGSILVTIKPQQQKDMKNVFVHHVFFWLKNAESKEDKARLIEGLKKLSAVASIGQFQIGHPAGTSRDVIDSSYAVSWLVLFNTREDQDSYQVDPIHLDFVKQCSQLWQKVTVYDSIAI